MKTIAEIRKAREYSKSLGGDTLPSEYAIDTLLFWIGLLRLQIKILLGVTRVRGCENIVESAKKLLEETV